jgi:hypothetical protein
MLLAGSLFAQEVYIVELGQNYWWVGGGGVGHRVSVGTKYTVTKTPYICLN